MKKFLKFLLKFTFCVALLHRGLLIKKHGPNRYGKSKMWPFVVMTSVL